MVGHLPRSRLVAVSGGFFKLLRERQRLPPPARVPEVDRHLLPRGVVQVQPVSAPHRSHATAADAGLALDLTIGETLDG